MLSFVILNGYDFAIAIGIQFLSHFVLVLPPRFHTARDWELILILQIDQLLLPSHQLHDEIIHVTSDTQLLPSLHDIPVDVFDLRRVPDSRIRKHAADIIARLVSDAYHEQQDKQRSEQSRRDNSYYADPDFAPIVESFDQPTGPGPVYTTPTGKQIRERGSRSRSNSVHSNAVYEFALHYSCCLLAAITRQRPVSNGSVFYCGMTYRHRDSLTVTWSLDSLQWLEFWDGYFESLL